MKRKVLDWWDDTGPWLFALIGLALGTTAAIVHMQTHWHRDWWRLIVGFGVAFAGVSERELILTRNPEKRTTARAGRSRNIVKRIAVAFFVGVLAGITGQAV